MKQALSLLAVALLAATITWFLVSRHMAARQAEQTAQAQARWEAERAALEAAARQARERADSVPAKADPGAQARASAPVTRPAGAVANAIDDGLRPTRSIAVIDPIPVPVAAPAVATAGEPLPEADTAATWVRYEATRPGEGSQCRIDGTSSIHDWHMATPIIAGTFDVDAQLSFEGAWTNRAAFTNGPVPARADVRIPVRTLKSFNAKMDEVYKEHMEERIYRTIGFHLRKLVISARAVDSDAVLTFDSVGELVIHGVTNVVSMPVTIEQIAEKKLRISGQTPLKMSSFGVTPPAPQLPGMPAMATGDNITVAFNWVVARP